MAFHSCDAPDLCASISGDCTHRPFPWHNADESFVATEKTAELILRFKMLSAAVVSGTIAILKLAKCYCVTGCW